MHECKSIRVLFDEVQDAILHRHGAYSDGRLIQSVHKVGNIQFVSLVVVVLAPPTLSLISFVNPLQHFVAMTSHKPEGRRWVSKEQYTMYFTMASKLVYPQNPATPQECKAAVQVCRLFWALKFWQEPLPRLTIFWHMTCHRV